MMRLELVTTNHVRPAVWSVPFSNGYGRKVLGRDGRHARPLYHDHATKAALYAVGVGSVIVDQENDTTRRYRVRRLVDQGAADGSRTLHAVLELLAN